MATTIVQGFQEPDNKSKGLWWIQKDPSDKKDYLRDWADAESPFLDIDNGETIASVVWVVYDANWIELEGDPGDLAIAGSPAPSNTTTAATVWLEGGTAGQRYFVTCRVTTSAGRIADDSFQVRCIQR